MHAQPTWTYMTPEIYIDQNKSVKTFQIVKSQII